MCGGGEESEQDMNNSIANTHCQAYLRKVCKSITKLLLSVNHVVEVRGQGPRQAQHLRVLALGVSQTLY